MLTDDKLRRGKLPLKSVRTVGSMATEMESLASQSADSTLMTGRKRPIDVLLSVFGGTVINIPINAHRPPLLINLLACSFNMRSPLLAFFAELGQVSAIYGRLNLSRCNF